jgi:thymidylate synthase
MNYLEIIKNVLENGTPKQATRLDNFGKVIPVENGTIGTFCEIFRHDMSQGFPLTTLRKMPWLSIRVELEGFIKGITDKEWYQNHRCKFWDEWANPILIEEILDRDALAVYGLAKKVMKSADKESYKKQYRKTVQKETLDLGPIYGYQWRSFNKTYNTQSEDDGDFHSYTDQLQSIVTKLKTNPYDRRMVCSAWNPNQMDMMALIPCHWGWNVVVYGNKLNLIWHQRSCDLMLGVGANIASYALLLMLLCKESGLKPGELVGTLADCHIYDNLMDNAQELIKREEKELPTITIKDKADGTFSIFDWTWDQVELIGYDPHPPIKMGEVTV